MSKIPSTVMDVAVEHDDPRPKKPCLRCDGNGTLLGHEFTLDEGVHEEPDLPYNCPVCGGTGYVLDTCKETP